MSDLVQIDFAPLRDGNLEYRVSSEFTPTVPLREYVVISDREAGELYFSCPERGKTLVLVVAGGQKGDESKGKTTQRIKQTVPDIKWASADTSTHNAGKSVLTANEEGKEIRLSLRLLPATAVDSDMKNYVGRGTQVNLFSLEKEISALREKTGRGRLGENYHVMVDRHVNLVVPLNRADDIVCKPAMASTISGATSSYRQAAGKNAPTLEDALYDPCAFRGYVNRQIAEFNDFIKHDSELAALGITDINTLGRVLLKDPQKLKKDKRLVVLSRKLCHREKAFFLSEDPPGYLLGEFRRIANSGLFYFGDCTAERNKHLEQGEAGILEGVQSVLLSGPIRYSKNRTAAGTHTAQIIANANLAPEFANYRRILVFKDLNTSVGGNNRTMSGFIGQDALSKLYAKDPKTGKAFSLEKTATLKKFLRDEEIAQAFAQVHEAFYHALKRGYSLSNSKVHLKGIDCKFSLAEANALLSAGKFAETGEVSGRARICRMDDLVETGVVYGLERDTLQVRNALDRSLQMRTKGFVTAYEVVRPYPGYNVGDIITPGMPLRSEHLTVESCIPIVDVIDSWPSLNADGTNELYPGARLHPNLCRYLSLVSGGRTVIAVGDKPGPKGMKYIKEV
ncbi:MAG: adenylosuccinate synthetase [Nanoarchaeota archaeon]